MVVTTLIKMVQKMPIDELDEYELSAEREAEYIGEVMEYMEAVTDEENTEVSVEVTREER